MIIIGRPIFAKHDLPQISCYEYRKTASDNMILGLFIGGVCILTGIAMAMLGWKWRSKERQFLRPSFEKFSTITKLLMASANNLIVSGIALSGLGLIVIWSLYN